MTHTDDVDWNRSVFLKEFRIKSGEDFAQIYAAKQRVGDGAILLFGLKNELPYSRIGLSVSKKHGGAIVRNRKKRLLREAFRLSRHSLPAGYDLILIPNVAQEADLNVYRKSLKSLMKRFLRKYEGGQ